jgi:hypothetical protein
VSAESDQDRVHRAKQVNQRRTIVQCVWQSASSTRTHLTLSTHYTASNAACTSAKSSLLLRIDTIHKLNSFMHQLTSSWCISGGTINWSISCCSTRGSSSTLSCCSVYSALPVVLFAMIPNLSAGACCFKGDSVLPAHAL